MSGREADPLFDMVPVDLGRSRSTVVAGGADDDGLGHVHKHTADHRWPLPDGPLPHVHSITVDPGGPFAHDQGAPRRRYNPLVDQIQERDHFMAFDADAFRALTFASEDNLSRFVAALSDEEAAAIYAMLYGRGVRYAPDALAKWRRSR